MKRFLRGSSSRSSKDKKSEEDKRPKYNLPRTAEVRPCEWPCDNFLRAAEIYDDFYELAKNAGVGVKTGGSRVGGPELCV